MKDLHHLRLGFMLGVMLAFGNVWAASTSQYTMSLKDKVRPGRDLIWLSVRVLVTLTLASGGAVAQAPGDACTARRSSPADLA